MKKGLVNKNAKFGTLPVFLTALSTILGAILFLRFGWAVGQIGLLATFGIIIIGHMVTIPTAMAVAEIATNQKVLGGGAYYIISRSFGLNIGGSIGIALFLSQAISVAFYVIAFAEAFDPVLTWLNDSYNIPPIDKRLISISILLILAYLMLKSGAGIGMKLLYVVVAFLFAAIISFFLGKPLDSAPIEFTINWHIEDNESFFYVFVIIFPAFTGLLAGLGLSGDLKNPRVSLPKGTIMATIVGMLVYFFIAYKFAVSASPEELVADQMIMSRIAIWGPIVPIGLAAACLSSALGSIIIAPRTLQAMGYDQILPGKRFCSWLAKGREKDNEPLHGSIITIGIALFFVVIGDINFVAEIISMFFILTYGAICLISFLEHFAADPSYRPTFRSRWYISAIGAVLSFWLMFKMNTTYALMSLSIIGLSYYLITISQKDKKGIEKLFRGVVFQLSRTLQIFAQRADKEDVNVSWRPFAVCVSESTFKRRSAFDFMRWISFKYGFGTYIHLITGFFNDQTSAESKKILKKLISLAKGSKNRVFLDTIISPSYTSAIAQVIQLNSITGKVNNLILFEFSRTEADSMQYVIDNYDIIKSARFDVCILNTSYKGFGYNKEIHIWITSKDYENANLMILIAYILLGHPDWHKGFIKLYAVYPESEKEEQEKYLYDLINTGRLPISKSNINIVVNESGETNSSTISRISMDADLTIVGFLREDINKNDVNIFNEYNDLGNVLFVSADKEKEIF
jgi:solute carrier family 12 (sodium/potassium/chloride transporter), member 2